MKASGDRYPGEALDFSHKRAVIRPERDGIFQILVLLESFFQKRR
jgi:hypothetical protein